MSFSGNGGSIEGYPFTIYSMEVINPKLGKISISLPPMQMDGTFTVIVGDDAIVLADRETGNTLEYHWCKLVTITCSLWRIKPLT